MNFSGFCQKQRRLDQPATKSATAIGGVSQDHAEPRQLILIAGESGGGDYTSVALQGETSLPVKVKQSFPIGLGLIPTSQIREGDSGGNVASGKCSHSAAEARALHFALVYAKLGVAREKYFPLLEIFLGSLLQCWV